MVGEVGKGVAEGLARGSVNGIDGPLHAVAIVGLSADGVVWREEEGREVGLRELALIAFAIKRNHTALDVAVGGDNGWAMHIDVGWQDGIAAACQFRYATEATGDGHGFVAREAGFLVHIDRHVGRDIENPVGSTIDVAHDAANSADTLDVIYFLTVGQLGISDDDVADFCVLR